MKQNKTIVIPHFTFWWASLPLPLVMSVGKKTKKKKQGVSGGAQTCRARIRFLYLCKYLSKTSSSSKHFNFQWRSSTMALVQGCNLLWVGSSPIGPIWLKWQAATTFSSQDKNDFFFSIKLCKLFSNIWYWCNYLIFTRLLSWAVVYKNTKSLQSVQTVFTASQTFGHACFLFVFNALIHAETPDTWPRNNVTIHVEKKE